MRQVVPTAGSLGNVQRVPPGRRRINHLRCASVGDSREEVERLIQEAIELHLEGMREEGLPIPPPASFAGEVEVHPAA